MDPSVIKKIQDRQKEKTQPEGAQVPAVRDLPHADRPPKSPEKSDKLKKDAPGSVEIQVA
jgi:hypothetical protein